MTTSERTPLLVEQSSLEQAATTSHVFPSLQHALRLLSAQLPITIKHIQDIVPDSAQTASISHRHAFFFAAVLYLEASVIADRSRSAQHLSAIARAARGLTAELWTNYSELRLEDADAQGISIDDEISELLWTPILVDNRTPLWAQIHNW